MKRARIRVAAALFALALTLWAPFALANRVSLDRDRIAFDETVTLTIEIDDPGASTLPDIAGLSRDFSVVNQTVSQEGDLFGGRMRLTAQLVLRPMHAGVIAIPTDAITGRDTAPLQVVVSPPRDPPPSPTEPSAVSSQQPVIVQASVDTSDPYVQQSVGYTLRMYYDESLTPEGELDVDAPQGASLIRTGEERQDTVRVGERLYRMYERHYLLVPERGGELVVPPAHFVGRTVNPLSAFFSGDLGDDVRVRSLPVALHVRPVPPGATQPWLPLRAATLRYRRAPTEMRVGEGATFEIEFVATGATADPLPALSLAASDGAQVFPERAETHDAFVDGAPRATVVRRFSVVPTRSGSVRIVGPRIAWWDAAAGRAQVATLPDLVLPVSAAAPGGRVDSTAPDGNAGTGVQDARDGTAWWRSGFWRWLLPGLAVLWLSMAAMLWAVKRWRDRAVSRPAAAPARAAPAAMSPPPPPALAEALAHGDLVMVATALCAATPSRARDLDAVRAQLADDAQRAAVDALQLARWGNGDRSEAIQALRAAFRAGPRWRTPSGSVVDDPLPPLYPSA